MQVFNRIFLRELDESEMSDALENGNRGAKIWYGVNFWGASVVLNCDSQCVRSVDILSVVTCLICHKSKFGTILA